MQRPCSNPVKTGTVRYCFYFVPYSEFTFYANFSGQILAETYFQGYSILHFRSEIRAAIY